MMAHRSQRQRPRLDTGRIHALSPDQMKIPERISCRLDLRHEGGGWRAEETRYIAEGNEDQETSELARGLSGDDAELEVARLLARYTEL